MEVMIPPFGTTVVKDILNFTTCLKCLNVIVEPVIGYSKHIAMTRSYWVLKPGRSKIDVCLRNHSAKQITLPKRTAVEEITAANFIPALLMPKPIGHGAGKNESTAEKQKN